MRWSGIGRGSGFSDHFPVAAKFVTVPDGRADRWIALRSASVEQPDSGEPPEDRIRQHRPRKVALAADKLPAGASFRSPAYLGKIVRVEGIVASGARLAVEFLGETYDVFSHDEALRKKLRNDFKAGDRVRFYGELGQYRGRWQFVIQDASWVK